MANNEKTQQDKKMTATSERPAPNIYVAPAPHLSDTSITTRRMMIDVLIALVPVVAMGIYFFQWYAVVQVGICVLSCMASEALFSKMRGKPVPIDDYSAAVTGVILGLSLPWSAPWYVAVIGAVAAIALGKAVFGGLGYNIFNPAMVGRAFVMLSFARVLGASSYVNPDAVIDIVTQATPLTAAKTKAAAMPSLWLLFLGSHNGSLGETSVLACLIGGLYLCVRRTASWEIPLSMLITVSVLTGLANIAGLSSLTMLQHLVSGALVFGAFFIATDPVSSPLSPKGKVIFGCGVGFFVVLIRIFSGYPEGVMFAVLLMNAVVPLINQLAIPRPLGGVARQSA